MNGYLTPEKYTYSAKHTIFTSTLMIIQQNLKENICLLAFILAIVVCAEEDFYLCWQCLVNRLQDIIG